MKDIERALPRPGGHRAQPVPGRRAAVGRGRQRHDQPDDAELSCTTRSTTRSSRTPGKRLHGSASTSRASAATSTSSSRGPKRSSGRPITRAATLGHAGAGRIHPAVSAARPGTARSSSGCSSAASTACAATTSGRSARATRHAGAPGTFIVLGGNKSPLFNAEFQYLDRRPGARDGLLRRRAGAGRRASECDWDDFMMSTGRRGPVLHAGAERAVPPDFRAEHQSRGHLRQQPAAGQAEVSFAFAVGSTF